MLERLVTAVIVGIVVFLVAWLILSLVNLPVAPWATLLGVLAGLSSFLGNYRISRL